MEELVLVVRSVLEMGFPAVVLIQIILVWREYRRRTEEHIRDLRYIASIRHEAPSTAWNGGSRPPLAVVERPAYEQERTAASD